MFILPLGIERDSGFSFSKRHKSLTVRVRDLTKVQVGTRLQSTIKKRTGGDRDEICGENAESKNFQ
jgi:hypothetical protein